MPETNQIGPIEVVRDENGYWWHPDIPEWVDKDPAT